MKHGYYILVGFDSEKIAKVGLKKIKYKGAVIKLTIEKVLSLKEKYEV